MNELSPSEDPDENEVEEELSVQPQNNEHEINMPYEEQKYQENAKDQYQFEPIDPVFLEEASDFLNQPPL